MQSLIDCSHMRIPRQPSALSATKCAVKVVVALACCYAVEDVVCVDADEIGSGRVVVA